MGCQHRNKGCQKVWGLGFMMFYDNFVFGLKLEISIGHLRSNPVKGHSIMLEPGAYMPGGTAGDQSNQLRFGFSGPGRERTWGHAWKVPQNRFSPKNPNVVLAHINRLLSNQRLLICVGHYWKTSTNCRVRNYCFQTPRPKSQWWLLAKNITVPWGPHSMGLTTLYPAVHRDLAKLEELPKWNPISTLVGNSCFKRWRKIRFLLKFSQNSCSYWAYKIASFRGWRWLWSSRPAFGAFGATDPP